MTKKNQKTLSSPKSKNKSVSNREFALITYMFLGIFLFMMGYFVYFQIVRSEDVINSPYNKRQDTFAEHVVRGNILSSDGKVLAQTVVDENGQESRYYPYGSMFAHAVGYDVNGKSGIESFANFNLLRSHAFFIEQIVNGMQNEKNPGDNVITTLNYKLQETAYQALGNHDGAVIVMEPSTGKILAMVSKPDFNPNTLAKDWENIVTKEDNSVLLNRVTQGLYPPGSTFKIITTLAYIRENPNYLNYLYECTGSITLDNLEMHCAKGNVHGTEDLMTSFAKSCNTSYANIGLELNKESFRETCHSLLFDTELPINYPFVKSRFSLNESSKDTMTMQTAIGQGETLMSPFHMAIITSAIANDGVLMKPYIIDHTENYKGISVKKYKPSVYKTLMTSSESAVLQEFMRYVVTDGTASGLLDENYVAAGKTGSAEFNSSKDETHAWFSGYATNEELGQIAVTVIVEEGGSGSSAAVPIAKKIFNAYFDKE